MAHKEVPFEYLEKSNEIISLAEINEEDARKKYPEVFKFVDLVNGVVVSVGNHPAGCVVSPFPVDEWFGTFSTSTDEYPISVLNMKEIDSLNFVKLDILALDNVGLIYKTCDAAGIPYATPDNIPSDDLAVWKSIVDDTTMIFQWESQSATAYLKQLMSDETIVKIKTRNPNFSYIDLLSIGNGAIRPAGDSYRNLVANGEFADHGNKELNEFMKPTLGFMIFQEEVMGFLNKFCGFTMGEADVVRRHFAKKTGTENDIPTIKDGGYLKDKNGNEMRNHYIKGFIKTMYDDYGVAPEESERIVESFLQVIKDASDYLFSKNHSDPYSWIGYICGYLRYYYPLEFITSALNIFEDKEDKSLAIINYAKKRGIKISPIKFRHSVAKYNFNKETNEIYKGLSSIKFMNEHVANEMYELRDNHYEAFVDLIRDLKTKTSLNERQLRILIDLEFFAEFGDANFLLAQLDFYNEIADRKMFGKDFVKTLGIPENLIRKYSLKETAKTFTGVATDRLMRECIQYIRVPRRKIGDIIKAQITHLGYVNYTNNDCSNIAALISIDTKYSPKCKFYSVKNGKMIDCKIAKAYYSKNQIKEGDIVQIQSYEKRAKSRKTSTGYETIPGEFELWITKYRKVEI